MEENQDQKKYRSVRDFINGLFNDGFCHTLQENVEVSKMVTINVAGKDKDGKLIDRQIQIRSGFNDICI